MDIFVRDPGVVAVWLLRAFCSRTADGNPTGVVFARAGITASRCQSIATRLGCPDTAFLTPGSDAAHWNARFFSPCGELSICIQAALASAAVVRKARPGLDAAALAFMTRAGPVAVSPARNGIAYVHLGRTGIKAMAPPPGLAALGAGLSAAPHAGCVIDMGRRRQYLRLAAPRLLAAVSLRKSQVRSYCRRHGLHGICLFARSGADRLALRVFTTSLGGSEDVSTGGAVAGLAAYRDPEFPRNMDEDAPWTIRQGSGGRDGRGELILRRIPRRAVVAVGGRVRFLGCWSGPGSEEPMIRASRS